VKEQRSNNLQVVWLV